VSTESDDGVETETAVVGQAAPAEAQGDESGGDAGSDDASE
jgi:hypothetical protein